MIRARFSPKAARDLDEISNLIAADNPEAAARVRRTILNTADFLAQHPEIGRRIRKAAARHLQIRWLVVPKFRNYLVFSSRFRRPSWWFAFCTRRRIGHGSFRRRRNAGSFTSAKSKNSDAKNPSVLRIVPHFSLAWREAVGAAFIPAR